MTVPARFPRTAAHVSTAMANHPNGGQPLFGPLYCTEMQWIAKEGFQIRGTEFLNNGQQVAQEWYIVPLGEKQDETKG